MTSPLLQMILSTLAHRPSASYGFRNLGRHSPVEVNSLISAGVLRPNGFVDEIRCEDSECGLLHEVNWLGDPAVPTYHCDTSNHLYWPAFVEARSWTVTFDGFAEVLAKSLGSERVTVATPDVRRIGTVSIGSKMRDVFVVRGHNHRHADKPGMFAGAVVIAVADSIANVGIDSAAIVLLASETCVLAAGEIRLDSEMIARAGDGLGPVVAKRSYLFKQSGEYWDIAFGGEPIQLDDSIGLHYIRYLIQNERIEISALSLVHTIRRIGIGAKGVEPGTDLSHLSIYDRNLGGGQDDYPLMDSNYKRSCVKYVEKLRARLDTAEKRSDSRTVEALKNEMAVVRRVLNEASAPGGRKRTFNSDRNKARLSVMDAVQTVRKKLLRHMPELHAHFEMSLITRTECQYLPNEAVPWVT